MDLSKIEKIAELMKAHGLAEVELEQGDEYIRLAFPSGGGSMGGGMMHGMGQPMMMPQMGYPAPSMPTARPAAEKPAESIKGVATGNQKTVKSPFVGTYYESSSPGSEPFARIGKRVKKGDTLCIVEAMKLMNGIESEFDGVIVEILAKNGEPVEYDQSLFIVEP